MGMVVEVVLQKGESVGERRDGGKRQKEMV